MAKGSGVFVLDIGKPDKIVDLAQCVFTQVIVISKTKIILIEISRLPSMDWDWVNTLWSV